MPHTHKRSRRLVKSLISLAKAASASRWNELPGKNFPAVVPK
jgi:hypothetical protein